MSSHRSRGLRDILVKNTRDRDESPPIPWISTMAASYTGALFPFENQTPGIRQKASYNKHYLKAQKKCLDEIVDYERKAMQTQTDTTYKDHHCWENFEPEVEKKIRSIDVTRLPYYRDPAFTLWYMGHQLARGSSSFRTTLDMKVSPVHDTLTPFRRQSLLTTPVHLSLYDPPVECPHPPPRASKVPGAVIHNLQSCTSEQYFFPLADLRTDVGKKYWSDRS